MPRFVITKGKWSEMPLLKRLWKERAKKLKIYKGTQIACDCIIKCLWDLQVISFGIIFLRWRDIGKLWLITNHWWILILLFEVEKWIWIEFCNQHLNFKNSNIPRCRNPVSKWKCKQDQGFHWNTFCSALWIVHPKQIWNLELEQLDKFHSFHRADPLKVIK